MGDLTLNHDVLHHVMSFADRTTLSKVMRTSSILNREGVRYLLRNDVVLRKGEEICSFLYFVLSVALKDSFRRLRFLRGISIDLTVSSLPEVAVRALRMLFTAFGQYATNLTRLDLRDAERILALDDELPSAIATLSSIRNLNIHDAGVQSCNMIRKAKWPLASVSLKLGDEFDGDEFDLNPEDKDPVHLLSDAQSTLESLEVYFTDTHLQGPLPPRYPLVRKLSLNYTDAPTTHHIAYAFPGLQELRTYNCANPWPLTAERSRHRREVNRSGQAQSGYGCWPSLRLYHGSLLVLYTMMLRCHVSRVRLSDADFEFHPGMLQAVLMDSTPEHLTLCISGGSHILREDFAAAFVKPGTQRLKTLDLYVELKAEDGGVDMGQALEVLSTVLASLTISAFKFRLHWQSVRRVRGTLTFSEIAELLPVEEFLEALDADAVADCFLAAQKSLKTVTVELEGYRKRGAMIAQRGLDIRYQ